jgi:beta-glucosidase
VKPLYETTPLEALVARLGAQGVVVTYAAGYSAEAAGAGSVSRLVGTSGEASIAAGATAGGAAGAVGANDAALLRERAVAVAREADAVVYFGGFDHSVETEMKDRVDMSLPYEQAALIRALIAANPRTVIVLTGGSAMDMDAWVRDARAVLFAPYGGSEGGAALARILTGDANPSGKLPITLARRLEDYAPHATGDRAMYPGEGYKIQYGEGIFVGYRYFDMKGIEPLFCFGHGLSYTRFEYSDLSVEPGSAEGSYVVRFRVANTGDREGAEVAQVYVSQKNPGISRPVRELKGFDKVFLKPGESRVVTCMLGADAFSYYDAERAAWRVGAGEYIIEAGASSRDVRLRASVGVR